MIAALLLAGTLSMRELYVDAIKAMSDLPQPQYVTYDLQAQSDGLQVDPVVQGGQVWLNVHGGSASAAWQMTHRTYDYATELVNAADGRRYFTQRSFFDPTWYGAYRALNEGMFDAQDPAAPRAPQATPPPDTTLKTIAVTAVMGPGIYTLQDRGEQACPNGDPGRALHLVSRERNARHQLTDVIIDTASNRFCMMRFAETSGFGFHGFLEQHYADAGGYWMQTGGFLDGTIRAFGISFHHGTWHYELTNMQFPSTLAPNVFTTNL